jgi:hypothetical protein
MSFAKFQNAIQGQAIDDRGGSGESQGGWA